MSKTKQRKMSAYALGRKDGRDGCFRYYRHPQMKYYEKGYRVGKGIKPARKWWQCQKCGKHIGLLGRFIEIVFNKMNIRLHECGSA